MKYKNYKWHEILHFFFLMTFNVDSKKYKGRYSVWRESLRVYFYTNKKNPIITRDQWEMHMRICFSEDENWDNLYRNDMNVEGMFSFNEKHFFAK